MKLVNIGFGNMVAAERVVAVVSPESAPIKRVVREAEDNGTLVNATYGRRTRAGIVMDSGEPAGRKLDFLIQEINREVNTIGSKASDLEVAKIVVTLKGEIEKLREQIQNSE